MMVAGSTRPRCGTAAPVGRRRRLWVCLSLALAWLPAACGPPRQIIDASGPVQADEAANAESLFNDFQWRWTNARTATQTRQSQDALNAANAALLDSGFALVHGTCGDFFPKKGLQQQQLFFTRDLVGVVSPLVTGALGLVPSAGIATPIVGLAGGGINSGISATANNFLFGSDNIEDVWTLTANALAAHQSTVKKLLSDNAKDANFYWVAAQIYEHQMICQPANILKLTKEAIVKGNVCAYQTASSKPAADAQAPAADAQAPAGAAKAPSTKPKAVTAANPPGAAPTSALAPRVGVRVQPACGNDSSGS